jgi:CheY-like chemotaxis protein
MPEKKILIVDDDPDLVQANRLYLEARGFEVRTAASAAEGLRALEDFVPDIITADLMMEHHDSGFAFCRLVRQRPQTARTPVLMLTGVLRETRIPFSRQTREERAFIAADELIAKPVTPRQLHDHIERHLGRAVAQARA